MDYEEETEEIVRTIPVDSTRKISMLIRVVYQDGKYDLVEPSQLDELIASGRVKRFLRSDGWATIGVSPLRGNRRRNDGKDNGVERLSNSNPLNNEG